MKKIITNIILIFILIMPVFVDAKKCMNNPEYEEWLKLSDSEKNQIVEPTHVVCYLEEAELSKMATTVETKVVKKENQLVSVSASDKKYDARDYGYVSDVDNQRNTNSCWAYTGNAVLESNLLLTGQGKYNFSEKHAVVKSSKNAYIDGINQYGFNVGVNDGGNIYMYGSYLMRHEGPIYESDYNYSTYTINDYKNISINDMPNKKALFDVGVINLLYSNEGCTNSKKEVIKNAILKYGSVGTTIYSGDTTMSTYYKYNGNMSADHAVTIIGWDDSISSTNFRNAYSDGAWIVKNSWGTNSGDNGYYYVSYEDTKVCNEVFAIGDANVNTYDNAYFSSNGIANLEINFFDESDTLYTALKFNTKDNKKEYINKISYYSLINVDTEIYLATPGDTGFGTLIATKHNTINGIDSVYLKDIEVQGEYYINIIDRYNSKTTRNHIAVACSGEDPDDLYSTLNTYPDGTYYYSFNGKTYYDANYIEVQDIYESTYSRCRPNYYVYTRNTKDSNPSINITSIEKQDEGIKVNVNLNQVDNIDLLNFTIRSINDATITDKFDIDLSNITNGYFMLLPKTSVSGMFYLTISYGLNRANKLFSIEGEISSTKYLIEDNMILVSPIRNGKITVEDILDNVDCDSGKLKLFDGEAELGSDNIVKTGTKVLSAKNTYYIVIYGDANGDGTIGIFDYIKIKNHILKRDIMTDPIILKAADANKDNSISIFDYIKIKNFIMNREGI